MIHEIGVELEAHLRALGVPVAVIDGPEPASTVTWGRERIVIEYDTEGSDSFGPPRGQHRNPKHRRTAVEACKLTIYAQSTKTGSTVFEHRRRVKHIRDEVLYAMDLVAAFRRNHWAPGAGKFLEPADLEKAEKQGGAVYELKFTFDRAVEVRTWAGATNPQASVGPGGVGITSTTNASLDDGDPTTDPVATETACGG